MNKTIAIVVASIATFAVAAPAQASAPTWSQKDKQFVSAVRRVEPAFKEASASNMIRLAHNMCKSLNLGYDEEVLLTELMDNGFTAHQASTIEVAAIKYYCPRHMDNWLGKPIRMT